MSEWIAVIGWDKFQHYGDRDPRWIKLYVELLDKPDWLALSPTAKSLLIHIWLLRARLGTPVETRILRLHARVETRSRHFRDALTSLNHAGLIAVCASNVLAQEEEKRRSAHASAHARPPARAREREAESKSGWGPNLPPRDREGEVRRLIANGVITEPFEVDAYADWLDARVLDELRALLG